MSLWNWYRLPVEERERICHPEQHTTNLCELIVGEAYRNGELIRKHPRKDVKV